MGGKKPAQKMKPRNGPAGPQNLGNNQLRPLHGARVPKVRDALTSSRPDVLIVHNGSPPSSPKSKSPTPTSSSVKLPSIDSQTGPAAASREVLKMSLSRPGLDAGSSFPRLGATPKRNASKPALDVGNTSSLIDAFRAQTPRRRQVKTELIRTNEIRHGHRIVDLSKPVRPELKIKKQENFSVVTRIIIPVSPPRQASPVHVSSSNSNSLASKDLEKYGLKDLSSTGSSSSGRRTEKLPPLQGRRVPINSTRLPPLKKR